MNILNKKYISRIAGACAFGLILISASTAVSAQYNEPEEVEEVVEVDEVEIDTLVTYTLTGSEKKLIAERVAQWNTPWKKVELTGRVSIDGLPIKPTVKLFMESGKKLFMSIRVTFLGEVARVEIAPDEVLVVNKVKKTYFKADPKEIFEQDPSIISELQALFLGRVALVGEGEFKADQVSKVDIVQQTSDEFLVIPADVQGTGAINFGYSVSPTGRLEEMIGVYAGFDGYASLSYARAGERLQIIGEVVGLKSKINKATIEFDAPDWDAKGFGKLGKLNDYREVKFRDVLKLN